MLTNEDIVAITQVVNLYGHILDGRLWDRLPEVFTEDAAFDMSNEPLTEVGGQVIEGRSAIREAFEWIEHALAHHVSNIYVYEADGEVRSLCKFFMPDAKGRFHTGEYDDVVVRTPSGWRIQRRTIRERRYWDPQHQPETALRPNPRSG
jgi:3-phenylpropionate/cinnamic acid dioxygenase small subunit